MTNLILIQITKHRELRCQNIVFNMDIIKGFLPGENLLLFSVKVDFAIICI